MIKYVIEKIIVSLVVFYLLTTSAFALVLFSEDFETGSRPFGFTQDNTTDPDTCNPSELHVEGGDRGLVWKTTFLADDPVPTGNCSDSYFGFIHNPGTPLAFTSETYLRFYIKYGDSTNAYTWDTAERTHELKFWDIGLFTDSRVIFKHRPLTSSTGQIIIYTEPTNHEVEGFNGNQWYCVEVLLQDNGATGDIVKIWVDNDVEGSPDYTSSGSTIDWFDYTDFSVIQFGYKNHAVIADEVFYFDDVVISTTFIGTGDSAANPEFSSATINGTAVIINWSEACTRGTGYDNSDLDLDMSVTGNGIGLTYVSGDGTSQWTMTAASSAVYDETVDLDFNGDADSIEDSAGNDLGALTSETVTNNTAGNTGLPWSSDFETGDVSEWDGYHGGNITIITDNPHGGSYCAYAPLVEGTYSHNYLEHRFGDFFAIGGDKVEEVYLTLYSKFEAGYVWPNDSQKIAILNLTDGLVSDRRYQVYIYVTEDGYYAVDHSYIDTWQFFGLFQNQGSPLEVNDDTWEKLKLYVKLNTSGQSDGIVKLWINDVLKVSYDSVNLRESTDYGIGKLILSSYAQDSSGSDGNQYYDDWTMTLTEDIEDTVSAKIQGISTTGGVIIQ